MIQGGLFDPAVPVDGGASSSSLFFTIFPDPATAIRIADTAAAIRARLSLHGRPIAADRLHVTLHYLGDYPSVPVDVIEAACRVGDSIAIDGFGVRFDRIMSFDRPGRRPIVMASDTDATPLRQLHAALGRALVAAGLGRHAKGTFKPHLTLLYDRIAVPAQPTEPVEWHAGSFELVESLVGRSTYRRIKGWPLRL